MTARMDRQRERQKDLILMAIVIQLTALAAVIPQLTLLAVVGGLITIAVAISEGLRRFDEYADR